MCMKKQTLVRDATVMLLALFAAYAMVIHTQIFKSRIQAVAQSLIHI